MAILRLRSLGDCVLSTPGLEILKRSRPDLRLAVMVEDRFRAVFEGNPDVDEILPPALGALRRWRPILCLNLHGGGRSAWMTALSEARYRAGFGHFRYQAVYNVRIPRAQEILGVERKVHTAEHLASAVFYLGAPITEIPRAKLVLVGRTPWSAQVPLDLPEADGGVGRGPGGPPHWQQYIRGLFSGGTFCTEAQVIFRDLGVRHVYSNVPLPPFVTLRNVWKSQQHTLIDLGEDVFTVGRPHPMIDYSLRNRRIVEEARDPETALILLDVVLGYGANMDPAGELAPVIREAQAKRPLVFACSVTGTPRDPQNRTKVVEGLEAAGARVFPSNAAASKFAAQVARSLEKS